jgi:hypothetical protein
MHVAGCVNNYIDAAARGCYGGGVTHVAGGPLDG